MRRLRHLAVVRDSKALLAECLLLASPSLMRGEHSILKLRASTSHFGPDTVTCMSETNGKRTDSLKIIFYCMFDILELQKNYNVVRYKTSKRRCLKVR